MAKIKGSTQATEPTLLQLDPTVILAEGNSRYGTKEAGIESLAEDILKSGGVIEPVEVELLDTPANGHRYKLTFGFKRHAAVAKLNAQGAGLSLPALLHHNSDPTERTKRQISENMQRESLSIMDQAVAMKTLMDSGVPRAEVREVFKRPGGRKGNKSQPISNAYLNMLISFLDFPKKIQDRIHNNEIGVAAAYELRKAPPEKWASILDRIEAESVKEVELDEKEEQRFLTHSKQAEEAQQKVSEAITALEAAKKKAEDAVKESLAKTQAADLAFKATRAKGLDKDQRKIAETAFSEAEKAKKIADADAIAATDEADKLQEKATKASQLAKERNDRLAKARAAKKPAVGKGDVQKSAAAEDTGSKPVPLTAAEMRKVVEEMCLPGGPPVVAEIGKILRDCLAGILTPQAVIKAIDKLVG
jgi:hypothetical protein